MASKIIIIRRQWRQGRRSTVTTATTALLLLFRRRILVMFLLLLVLGTVQSQQPHNLITTTATTRNSSSTSTLMLSPSQKDVDSLFPAVSSFFHPPFSYSSSSTSSSISRSLQQQQDSGDFQELNALLQYAIVRLIPDNDDSAVSFPAGLGVTFTMQNLRCQQFSVGNMRVSSSPVPNGMMNRVKVPIDIVNLSMICQFDYKYWGLLRIIQGGGSAKVVSSDNTGSATTIISSSDWNPFPESVVVDSCNVAIQINDIQFSGGGTIQDWILNGVKGPIGNRISNEAQSWLCEELVGNSAKAKGQEWLRYINQKLLDPYDPNMLHTPLQREETLLLDSSLSSSEEEVDDGISFLLNFQNTQDDRMVQWFHSVLEEGVTFLNDRTTSEQDEQDVDETDKNINSMLRNHVLDDESRALILTIPPNNNNEKKGGDSSSSSSGNNEDGMLLLWEGSDKLTNSQIWLNSIQVLGLDTFTLFEPLDSIGRYTLQTQLSWEYLTVELDLTLHMEPSDRDDSVIERTTASSSQTNNNGLVVEEGVKAAFRLNDPTAVFSFLLAIDRDTLESIELGTMLDVDALLPCLLSVVHDFAITGLALSVTDIESVSLDGFVSSGLDRVISDIIEAAFLSYKDMVLERIPTMFQTTVKDYLNNKLVEYRSSQSQNQTTGCARLPLPASMSNVTQDDDNNSKIMDLRDVLLSPGDAVVSGASGKEPYGSLISSLLIPWVDSQLLPVDRDNGGLPLVNSRIIRPLTKAQSGTEGSLLLFPPSSTIPTLLFAGPNKIPPESSSSSSSKMFLFSTPKEDPPESSSFTTSSSLLSQIEFRTLKASIENVDTFTLPLSLFQPTAPDRLKNEFGIGPVASKPLTLSSRFLLSTMTGGKDGDDSSKTHSSLLSMKNDVEVRLMIPSSKVVWDVLARIDAERLLTIPLSGMLNYNCWLDALATDTIPSERTSLELQNILLSLSELDFSVNCIECTSAGVLALPEIVSAMQDAGLSTIFKPLLERFVEDFVWSSWEMLEIDNKIQEAANRCPSSPRYDEKMALGLPNATMPNFLAPILSREALETIVATGVLVAETSVIVVAKSHLPENSSAAEFSDPFSGQIALINDGNNSNTNGDDLVNWENLDGTVGNLVMSSIESAKDYLTGTAVEDSNFTLAGKDNDLSANILIRNSFLDDDGIWSFKFDNVSTSIGEEAMISLEALHIEGLDSMVSVNSFMEAIAPQTLSNSLVYNNLVVTFDIGVHKSQKDAIGQQAREQMSLSFGMRGVMADFDLLLAADLNHLGTIELGSLMHGRRVVSCITSSLHDFQITRWLVKVEDIQESIGSGVLSPTLQNDISMLVQKTVDTFRSDMIAAMPHIFDRTARSIVNDVLRDAREKQEKYESICDWSKDFSTNGNIDFRDLFLPETKARELGGSGNSPYGDMFPLLVDNLKSRFLNAPTINDFLRTWTKNMSGIPGSVTLDGEVFNSNFNVTVAGLFANAQFSLSDVQIVNLDSIGEPLAVLDPVPGKSNALGSAVSFGVGDKSFRVSGRALVALSDGNELNLRNEVDIGLSLKSLRYAMELFLNMPHSRLFDFPLKDTININCWLVRVLSPPANSPVTPSAGIVDQKVHLDDFEFNVSCAECSSPKFDDFITHLYSPTEKDDMGSVLNRLAGQFLGGNYARDFILQYAAKQCPHNSAYDADASWAQSAKTQSMEADEMDRDNKAMLFNVTMGIVTFLVIILVITGKLLSNRRHRDWVESLDDEGALLLSQQNAKEKKEAIAFDQKMKSMFHTTEIPWHVRYGVPVLIIFNIAIQMGGHFAPISIVDLEGHIAGDDFFVEGFLEFSFFPSVIRTYKNGGSETAVFIIMFSFIWPYIKLSLLAVTWFITPRRLSISNRGSTLLWLDILAKLSVVDVLTMILLVSVLLVFIGGPADAFSETNEYYSLRAIVTPKSGAYCFVVAQRISRISSRYLLDWHRRIVNRERIDYESRQGQYAIETMDQSDSSEECGKSENAHNYTHSSSPVDIEAPPRRPAVEILDDKSNTNSGCVRGMRSSFAEESKEEECASDSTGQLHNECQSSHTISPKKITEVSTSERKIYEDLEVASHPAASSALDDLSDHTPENVKNPKFLSLSTGDDNNRRFTCTKCVSRFGGTAGIVFTGIAVLTVFITGIALGPAVSFDTNAVWELSLESGKSFAEDARVSLFRVVSKVLLKARWVLKTNNDYIALVVLIAGFAVSSFLFPVTQAIKNCRKWIRERKTRKRRPMSPQQKKIRLPAYIERMYLWRGMEVYIISFVIALWQMSAVSAYAIHLYCILLEMVYDTFAYVGLVDPTDAQCFRIQASAPLTIFVIFLVFAVLTTTFLLQAYDNYRHNRRHVETLIESESKRLASEVTARSSFWNLDSSQVLVKEASTYKENGKSQSWDSDASSCGDQEAVSVRESLERYWSKWSAKEF